MKAPTPTKRISAIISAIVLAGASTGLAQTAVYYRFEGSGAIAPGSTLTDATGLNNATATQGGTGTGAYSTDVFGSPVPNTGATNASSFSSPGKDFDALYGLVGSPNSNLSFGTDESFTIEAWVKLDSLTTDPSDLHYVAWKKPTSSADTATEWGFNIGGNISGGNGISLFLGNNNVSPAGLSIAANTWWYVSAAFDGANDLVRFTINDGVTTTSQTVGTLFNPTAGSGQLTIATHLNSSDLVSPGFGGFLDEVRITQGFLGTNDLLIAAVPEPATSALLISVGLVFCAVLRHRRSQAVS